MPDPRLAATVAWTGDSNDLSEGSTQKLLTTLERAKLVNVPNDTNAQMLDKASVDTGATFFEEMGGAGTTTATWGAGAGAIVDNSDPENVGITHVSWSAGSRANPTDLLTYWYVNSAGSIVSQSTELTRAERRTKLSIGVTAWNGTNIQGAITDTDISSQTSGRLRSFMGIFGILHEGGGVSSRAADTTLARSDAVLYAPSISHEVPLDPDSKMVAGSGGAAITFRHATSSSGQIGADRTTVDVGNYNPSGDTVSAIPGSPNIVAPWVVLLFPSGTERILYPQVTYSDMTEAEANVGSYSPTIPAIYNGAVITGYLLVKKSATDFTDDTHFKKVSTDIFGSISGAVSVSGGGLVSTDIDTLSKLDTIVADETILSLAAADAKYATIASMTLQIAGLQAQLNAFVMANEHFVGSYASLGDLQTANPSPNAIATAKIDPPGAGNASFVVWDQDSSTWV